MKKIFASSDLNLEKEKTFILYQALLNDELKAGRTIRPSIA